MKKQPGVRGQESVFGCQRRVGFQPAWLLREGERPRELAVLGGRILRSRGALALVGEMQQPKSHAEMPRRKEGMIKNAERRKRPRLVPPKGK